MTTKRADALRPTRSGTTSVTLGTKDPSGRGAKAQSATGSKTGTVNPDGGKVLVETEANNMEQGTGRKRVVQERGGQMGGHD